MLIGEEQVALAGDLGSIGPHHHAAPAIVVGVDRPLRFIANGTRQCRAALIAPGFHHAVELYRGRIAVFVLPAAGAPLHRETVHELGDAGPWLELAEAVAERQLDSFEPLARCLAREHLAPRPLDERLRRALTSLAGSLDDNLGVEELAASAGLSPTRLMALARAQLGTSLRGYRRWLRAFHVARQYARGASLTEAALEAGFASSAHLSMAVREQFGIRPSQLLTPRTRSAIRSMPR